jgi:hypothetical protein
MTAPTTPSQPVSASSEAGAAPAVNAAAVAGSASNRSDRFRRDLADMKIKEPRVGRDNLFLKAGLVLLAAGIVVAIVAYSMSHSTTNALQQRDAFTIGLIGVTLSIAGAAIYLRYSLAAFLRFWLARFLFEQQRTDSLSLPSDAAEGGRHRSTV